MKPVDTSRFQFGVPRDDDPEFDPVEERVLLDAFEDEARGILESQAWVPGVESLLLAAGIGRVIALYLARFPRPALIQPEVWRDEMWMVVGDLPTVIFTTDASPTRADALRTYCEICAEWVEAARADGDVSGCYDMGVEPTEEHARMLESRIRFIRDVLIPEIEEAPGFHMDGWPLKPAGR